VGRLRRRWVDNIREGCGGVGWGDVDCIGLAQDNDKCKALVNAVMNFPFPDVGELSSGYPTGGLLSSAQLHRFRVVSY
jgi:hypothetical protein